MAQTILRLPAVKARTGLSRSTIYLRISEGTFPRPVSLGSRAVGWPDGEVETLNAARIAGQSEDEIRALVARLEEARKQALPGATARSGPPDAGARGRR
jgi:prophage regulatory protein